MEPSSRQSSLSVKTRFAPSPTGYLHIGGARTALFNWLYARRRGGRFLLRIEDSDPNRNSREATETLLEALRWLGLDWDEGPESADPHSSRGGSGPYFQSHRQSIYQHHIARLMDEKKVYEKDGAIWFRMPKDPMVVHDCIVGKVLRKPSDREIANPDFVLIRADGKPVFHFVNVVDDLEMGITHVLRGEDHLSNTPKHLALFDALGSSAPHYAHIPLILNSDGSKMSKRDGSASIGTYMNAMYLPEALRNYLCLLGWSPKDGREIMDLEKVKKIFDLPQILRHNARFDLEKLRWMNGVYLNQIETHRYETLARRSLQKAGFDLDIFPKSYISKAIQTTRGKIRILDDLRNYAGFYFLENDEIMIDKSAFSRYMVAENLEGMRRLRNAFADLDAFDLGSIQRIFKETAAAMGVKVRALVHPIRVACTGKTEGPSLYDLIAILGKDSVLRRIDRAIIKVKRIADLYSKLCQVKSNLEQNQFFTKQDVEDLNAVICDERMRDLHEDHSGEIARIIGHYQGFSDAETFFGDAESAAICVEKIDAILSEKE